MMAAAARKLAVAENFRPGRGKKKRLRFFFGFSLSSRRAMGLLFVIVPVLFGALVGFCHAVQPVTYKELLLQQREQARVAADAGPGTDANYNLFLLGDAFPNAQCLDGTKVGGGGCCGSCPSPGPER
jgi:hypothetical protein